MEKFWSGMEKFLTGMEKFWFGMEKFLSGMEKFLTRMEKFLSGMEIFLSGMEIFWSEINIRDPQLGCYRVIPDPQHCSCPSLMSGNSTKMIAHPCRGRRGVPVEFMETVETSNGSSHHQISLEQEGGGTVLLDPVGDSSWWRVWSGFFLNLDPTKYSSCEFVLVQHFLKPLDLLSFLMVGTYLYLWRYLHRALWAHVGDNVDGRGQPSPHVVRLDYSTFYCCALYSTSWCCFSSDFSRFLLVRILIRAGSHSSSDRNKNANTLVLWFEFSILLISIFSSQIYQTAKISDQS